MNILKRITSELLEHINKDTLFLFDGHALFLGEPLALALSRLHCLQNTLVHKSSTNTLTTLFQGCSYRVHNFIYKLLFKL